MIPGSANALLLATAAGEAGGYSIPRSVRFNSSDSAYLSRTPGTASNRRKWTWAGWVKKTGLLSSGDYILFDAQAAGGGTTHHTIHFSSGDILRFRMYTGSAAYELRPSAAYRDPSAWMHIVAVFDSENATSGDRAILYVNGTRVTTFTTETYPALNLDGYVNDTGSHAVGRFAYTASGYGNFLLADIHFIDGQALDPTSFTEVDATTGQLVPIEYTGTYGTNGFHLPFSDNSTAAALGTDTSGNSNTWTVNNISVTAGAGNDSLVDTPTSSGTDTGAGGEVRGNYCTLNPLSSTGTMSNGNLDSATNAKTNYGTIAYPTTGKWYWECTLGGSAVNLGLAAYRTNAAQVYLITDSCLYSAAGVKNVDGVLDVPFGSSSGSGDIIGVAANADTSTVEFFKNGVSMGTISHGVGGRFPVIGDGNTSQTATANFGQRPFAYTAPSGFKALCDTNLPAPVVAKPSTVMDVKLYTGNGSTQTISGLGFSPDLVWVKQRNTDRDHCLCDVVRGPNLRLRSNSTFQETNESVVTAFNTNGFDIGSDAGVNQSSGTYVAWTWDAGSSTVSNTDGSITSQVRANPSAGFSVVTWTANNGAATIGHGLGVAPEFIIVKDRDTSTFWQVYHKSMGNTNAMSLNSTNAASAGSGNWNNTSPTSTVFSVGVSSNYLTDKHVAYCFAPVDGYSSGFSYTGNGSTDGSFVYLGFRPRLILLKCSSTTGNWTLVDTAREGYNVDNDPLYPNLSNAEGTTDLLDITSNGFKLRTTDASVNSSGATYIGFAWAELPFKTARAR